MSCEWLKVGLSASVKNELCRRADIYARQSCLVVDYYRVRRRLAFPLPINAIPSLQTQIPQIDNYPWSVWLSWALEERINCLGWAAQCLGHTKAQHAVTKDLYALSQWPRYREFASPDLCLGHIARTLATAYRQWTWTDSSLHNAIGAALQRIVVDSTPLFLEHFGAYDHKEAILSAPAPHRLLHNIPFIGGLGAALAGNALHVPRTKHEMNTHLHALVMALLDMRETGFSEGVAYDGYLLDFIVDWLYSIPAEERAEILDHPQFSRFLEESYMLAAPGTATEVVTLSDVEPEQMPFHVMAQVKAYHLRPTTIRRWYLKQLGTSMLRTDALLAWSAVETETNFTIPTPPPPNGQKEGTDAISPKAGALHAHYAVVLRSGWQEHDLAVAVAASNSPLGHIHCNNGSIAIGTQKNWFLTTPGYQQYIQNSEREFTTGVTAQNMPVINGSKQDSKNAEILTLTEHADGCYETEIDVTACYPTDLSVDVVKRRVLLQPNRMVIVEDTVTGYNIDSLHYYWHGHPDAAWIIQDGWAGIYLAETTLWIHSPQVQLNGAHLHRLKGSRGHLSLAVPVVPGSHCIQWYFTIRENHPHTDSSLMSYLHDSAWNNSERTQTWTTGGEVRTLNAANIGAE